MRHANKQIFKIARAKQSRNNNPQTRPDDPSEQEIQRLCEQIQADWSEDEREARRLWMPMNQTLVRPNRANLERFTIPWVKVG
jgi:hypothetical protein